MIKRPLLLISLILLIFGCARAPAPVANNKSMQIRAVSSFNQIVVSGNVNINLHTGNSKSQVVLRGDPRDLEKIEVHVDNRILTVVFTHGKPKFGPVSVETYSQFLNSLSYNGDGSIIGKKINSGLLDLDIANSGRTIIAGNISLRKLRLKGTGYTEIKGIKTQDLQITMIGRPRVQLAGVAKISTLDLEGDGLLGLYWVKSDLLTIRAKGGVLIQLAGIANKLDLELWGHARFNGRYLRAKRVFAKTHNKSVAEITSTDRQHTLATDASNIYFYNIPEMKTDFMGYSGAVLDMRDWNMPFMKDYDEYNK